MPRVDPALEGALMALLIGLLLGLDRERAQRDRPVVFAGIRTFPLVALLGYLGALGGQHGFPHLLTVVVLGVGALGAASFALQPGRGATTEVTALVAALLGAVVGWGQAPLAGALAVIATLLLTLRDPLHRLAGSLTEDEVLGMLKFFVVAIVVLPLLPREAIGPFAAIVPHDLGVLVVLLTAVSLAGYVLVRVFGKRAGWALAGALGGLVSSTAVTLSFASRAKESPALVRSLALGIVLASTVLYGRSVVVTTALDRPLGAYLAPRLAVLFLIGCAMAFAIHRRDQGPEEPPNQIALGNPVELGRAALLTAIFAVVTFAARAAQHHLGTAGLWSVGILGGLVDVDAVAVAAAGLRRQQEVEVPVAAASFLLATLSNLAFKGGVVVVVAGSSGLARQALPAIGILALATIALVAFA